MDFQFGTASALYEQQLHPRLFFGPDDVPALRAKIGQDGLAAQIMVGLRRRMAEPIRTALDTENLPCVLGAWNRTWHEPGTRVVFGLQDMATVALLDEDAAALEAVRRVLRACVEADAAGRREPVRRFSYSAIGQLARSYDVVAARLSDDDRRIYTAWAAAAITRNLNTLRPRYFLNAGANMAVGGMLNTLTAVLAIAGDPGVPDLTAPRDELVHMLEATLRVALNADGYPEEDIGYGTGIAHLLADVVEPLRRAGLYDVYADCPRYARFGRAILHFVQPWGRHLSNTGDHGDDFGGRELILARLAVETDDPALVWLARTLSYCHGCVHPENRQPEFRAELSLGAGEQLPATTASLLVSDCFLAPRHPSQTRPPTAFCDRTRGLVSFRDSWDSDATFVVFDGSQRSLAAQGHAHASCGHFSISALGEYFSIDTGRYNNEQTCHSVVLINGKSGHTWGGEWRAMPHAGLLTAYAPGDLVDTAAVDSSLQHNCLRARRELFLVKGAGVIPYVIVVDDLNACNDWSEYWWQLQTSPENRIETAAAGARITGWRHGNHMAVHFALPSGSAYPQPHTLRVTQDVGTASSTAYVGDVEAKAAAFARPADMVHGPVYTRPRLLGIVAGYNGRFLSAMLPYRRAEAEPVFAQLDTVQGTLAVRISRGAVRDTFIYAYENHMLEADGIAGRGRWCMVRRHGTGPPVAHAGETEWLAVDGRRMVSVGETAGRLTAPAP